METAEFFAHSPLSEAVHQEAAWLISESWATHHIKPPNLKLAIPGDVPEDRSFWNWQGHGSETRPLPRNLRFVLAIVRVLAPDMLLEIPYDDPRTVSTAGDSFYAGERFWLTFLGDASGTGWGFLLADVSPDPIVHQLHVDDGPGSGLPQGPLSTFFARLGPVESR